MGTWIDFKLMRETLDFPAVLQYYEIQYKRRGTQAVASCPLPTHKGPRTSPSFSVSFEKRIWQCFGCGAKGNVLDFISHMEGLDPHNAQQFRRAAVLAQERFVVSQTGAKSHERKAAVQQMKLGLTNPPIHTSRKIYPEKDELKNRLPLIINEPLDFALKNLDPKPQYLLNRGFSEQTIAHFGLGYCSKGLLSGRIAIPLHDLKGRLIGYAGRIIYDDAIDKENPKYLFPSKREHNGKIYEFAKSLFVYNGNQIHKPVDDLIIVQSFPSVWWLWQHGYQNAVALMSSSCSVDQAKLIVDLVAKAGHVFFLTDGNKDGHQCGQVLFGEVGPRRFCRWIKLPTGQVTEYSLVQLREMFGQ